MSPMRFRVAPAVCFALCTVALLLILFGLPAHLLRNSQAATERSEFVGPTPRDAEGIRQAFADLPMSFEVNQGQTDRRAKFVARGNGYNLFLTATGAVFSLGADATPPRDDSDEGDHAGPRGAKSAPLTKAARAVLGIKLDGANTRARVDGLERLPGRSNYFIGRNEKDWHVGVERYSRVKYTGVYPGVDLVYYGNQRQLEYDFVVAPGARPEAIALSFDGAQGLSVDDDGGLVIKTAGGELRQHKPLAYQEVDGARRKVSSGYKVDGAGCVHFELADYDHARPLVIDPVLVFSTYFGGSGADGGSAIAVDASGNAYVTGYTNSLNFPGSAVQAGSPNDSASDAFVVKLNAAGTGVVYSSYFGGANTETGNAIAVDASGNAYVAGYTDSFNFPVAGNPFQAMKSGSSALLKSGDSGLSFSPAASGVNAANIGSLAVSPASPNTVLAGTYGGAGLYKSTNGGTSWSVSSTGITETFTNAVAFDPSNTSVAYAGTCGVPAGPVGGVYKSTNGGANWTRVLTAYCINALKVDSTGRVYAGGFDGGGVYESADGGANWTNIDPTGNSESVTTLAIAPSNESVIYAGTDTGIYRSSDSGATWSRTNLNATSGNNDNSLAVDPFDPNTAYSGADGILRRTTDGGANWVAVNAGIPAGSLVSPVVIAPTSPTTVYVGSTHGVRKSADGGANWAATGLASENLHSLAFAPSSLSTIYAGVLSGSDAFVAKVSPDGSSLVYSTYLGGGTAGDRTSSDDTANAIAVDASGNAYVAGYMTSMDFPAAGALQSFSGQLDAFVTKLSPSGSSVIFSTPIGGPGTDVARGLALDGSSVYVVGNNAGGLATTVGPAFGGGASDAFVGKLVTSDGGNSYSYGYLRYLGGTVTDQANAVAVSSGNLYVAGLTNSAGFPVSNAAQGTKSGSLDAFLTKLDGSGSILFSTFHGGSGSDRAQGVTADASGNAYIVGYTASANFPTRNPIQGTYGGGTNDAFVAAYGPTGARLNSTYFGGAANDQGFGVAAGPTGSDAIYVTGVTSSTNLLTQGGIQNSNGGGGSDAFVAKFFHASSPDPEPSATPTPSPTPTPTPTPGPATFVVNTAADTDDGSCDAAGVGAGNKDCTLREAVNAANTHAGTDTINFNIPGAGTRTINVTSGFSLNEAAIIDATTQPGYAGQPVVEVNGAGSTNSNGFYINAANCTVRGLVINSFTYSGIEIHGDNVVIEGNYVGTDASGTAGHPNGTGVNIASGAGVRVGGTTAAARNILSGNNGAGVSVNAGVTGAVIQGNYIGTNAAGTAAISNSGTGVSIYGATNTMVGGLTAGAGNVISGNNGGITVGGGSANTKIYGNRIGTNAAGSSIILNTFGGVSINGGSTGTRVGDAIAGAGNLITGNGGTGVDVNNFNGSSNGNYVLGNLIGTDATGTSVLSTTVGGQTFYGNGSGVVITASSDTQVGGTSALARNVISGNNCQGVNIINALVNNSVVQASNNRVQGNYIGLNKDGTGYLTNPSGAPFGNKCSGVFIAGATGNLVGGTEAGAGNVIGGSAHQGVVVSNNNGVVGSNNTVQGNLIGSNVSMTTPLPNGIGVFLINGASNNQIGGDDAADGSTDGVVSAGNKIFGSTGDGVNIASAAGLIATGNKIQGNLIGGSTALRNGNNGVNLNGASNNVVGGTTAGAGNTISFNNNNGIVVNCPTLSGVVTCGIGNLFQRNSIFSHPNNLGIRLNGSGSSFGNNNIPAPTINFATASGGGTQAQSTLVTGVPNLPLTIEYFANDSCNNQGSGEGQTFLGDQTVMTDGNGSVTFLSPILPAQPVGKVLTATTTHTTNGTSRFSTCRLVSPEMAAIRGRATTVAGAPLPGATVTLSGGQSATATTNSDGRYEFPNLVSSVGYTVSISLPGATFYPSGFTVGALYNDYNINFTKVSAIYSVTDLGALAPAGTQSVGWDVNNSGQATGWSATTSSTTFRPFFYNGTLTSLSPLASGTDALGIAINNAGRVVGYSNLVTNGPNHGFFSDSGGAPKEIGTFGGTASQAWGLNDNGIVVGQANTSGDAQTHPFIWRDANNDGLWQQSEMIDIGQLGSGNFGRLFAVNNQGVAVGNSNNVANGGQLPTLWRDDNNNGVSDPGELRSLGTLGGATGGSAQGINETGHVSGWAATGQLSKIDGRAITHAFIWHDDNGNGASDSGEMKDIGTLGGDISTALRINEQNEVVGTSTYIGVSNTTAFLYRNNFMLNLNAAIPPAAGWSLTEARGINDNGQIAGYGSQGNGPIHALLLTPVATTKSDQTITFDAVPDKTYGDAPFALSASASSGLPVAFQVVSGTATVSGNTLTITGAGSVQVRASQAGDDGFNPAPDVERTFNVAKATPVITWSNPADISYGTPLGASQLNATASAPGTFAYTPASGAILASGDGRTLHVDFTPSDAANYNAASKDVSINVIPAHLSIANAASAATPEVGKTFFYTVTVTNDGPATATPLSLIDQLPAALTFNSAGASQGTCSFASATNKLTCQLGILPSGESATVALYVKPKQDGLIVNTASFSAPQFDPATGGSSASATVTAAKYADVSVKNVAPTSTFYVGDTITYTLTVANNGLSAATGVALSDTLAPGTTFVSATTSLGSLVTPPVGSTGIVTANLGEMAYRDVATVVVTARFSASGSQTNSASVSANEADSNADNNSWSQTSTVKTRKADLSVAKTDSVDPVYIGPDGVTTYTMVVTNAGPDAATGVTLTDTLPVSMQFVSATTSQGTLDVPAVDSTGTVTASLGDVASGATATVTVTVRPTQAGTFTNSAVVVGNELDPNPNNNTGKQSTTARLKTADLKVSNLVSIDPVYIGPDGVTTYTLTVTNLGPDGATNASLVDTLPASMLFVSATTTQGTLVAPDSGSTGVVTANLGAIASNATATVTVTVRPTQAGSFVNTATASADEADPVPGNNSAGRGTTVRIRKADLSVTKVDSVDPVYIGPGGVTTYTMVVTNAGPDTATGAALTDTLPASMQFVSATTTRGTLVTPEVDSTGVVTALLGDMTLGSTATVTVTVRPTQAGSFINTATVSANEADPNVNNNNAKQGTTIYLLALQKVTLSNQSPVGGCQPYPTGQVFLTAPAPPGGVTVNLASTNTGATVPSSVTIAAGQTKSDLFNVTTFVVPKTRTGLVTATFGGGSVSRSISVYAGTCPP